MKNYDANKQEIGNCLVFCGSELEGQDCINYYPGMLAEIEEKLAEAREKAFQEELFCGCGC
ncbi:MAG: hypothetical protein ACP5VS_08515 [Desulfomonilaceae bacterium]